MAAQVQANVPQAIVAAMGSCGFSMINDNAGDSPAERIARSIFCNSFDHALNITVDDIRASMKIYHNLTLAEGRIHVQPNVVNNMIAFYHWWRHLARRGEDPQNVPFPVNDAPNLLQQLATHDKYVKNASVMADAAKPAKFTQQTEWMDWFPSFNNYVRLIPATYGQPLSYVIRDNDAPDPTPQETFLDEYVLMAPLHGEAYANDNATLHSLLKPFVAGNREAEDVVSAFNATRDGRGAWLALRQKNEGEGVYAKKRQFADWAIHS